MPAEIFGNRFYSLREPAWHRIGVVFDEPISASEGIERAGLNYDIALQPLYFQESEYVFVPINNKQVVVRAATEDDPQTRVFGIVGDNYRVITNRELGILIDPLTKEWPVETVGALGKGETVFITLSASDSAIGNDHIKHYFLVTDSKGTGDALTIAFVPLRVVCQNTLVTGLRSASASVNLRHYGSVVDEAHIWVDLIKAAEQAEQSVIQTLQMMASSSLGPEEIEEIIACAYPPPRPGMRIELLNQFGDSLEGTEIARRAMTEMWTHESQLRRTQEMRAAASRVLTTFNDEQPEFANTAWAVYNSVVELEDWRDGRERSIETSALFGKRAEVKKAAFSKALEFIN